MTETEERPADALTKEAAKNRITSELSQGGKTATGVPEPPFAESAASAGTAQTWPAASAGEKIPTDDAPQENSNLDRKVPFRDDMLVLSDEKSVGIFLHPLRQRMLERMMILAEPVTSKRLADELGIAPSSARHHMQKLESIGVVEKDHQQLIHGILATYCRLTDKCISLDVCNTGLWDPTRRLLEENARQVREGALKMMKDWQQSPSQNWDDAWGLIETNGVIHLTREETLALRDLIGDYLQQHSQPRPGTAPIRFDLISYRAGEVKDDGGQD